MTVTFTYTVDTVTIKKIIPLMFEYQLNYTVKFLEHSVCLTIKMYDMLKLTPFSKDLCIILSS